jgi:tagatose-6-phosphate ketose/aldose isomerase
MPANAPDLPDALRTPFEIPFAQLLAYHLSVRVEVDPDNPSPDGAITRVVRPFRIHETSGISGSIQIISTSSVNWK